MRSTSLRVSASTHCKSSRKITSGWVFSQKRSMKSSKTVVKRLRDSSAPISGSGGCGPITRFQFRDHPGHQLSVGPQGSPYPAFPTLHSGFLFGRYLPDESPQSLDQGAVGDIVPELVKLAGEEESVFLGNGLIDFTDQGGFADTGGSRDQHHLGPSLADSLQGAFQGDRFHPPGRKAPGRPAIL